MNRKQVGGDHYQLGIEPIDYIIENGLGFCEGNVIKYITRHKSKGGADDIRKAIQYCEFILDTYKQKESHSFSDDFTNKDGEDTYEEYLQQKNKTQR